MDARVVRRTVRPVQVQSVSRAATAAVRNITHHQRGTPMNYRETKSTTRTAPHKTVNVTQAHLDHAERNNSRTCAIAIALAEAGALRPIIHRGKVSFTMNGERFTYWVPPHMAQYILDFDKHGPAGVQPKSLRLRDGQVHKCYRSGGPDRTAQAKKKKAPDGRSRNRVPRTIATARRLDGFVVMEKK
jgi:hypothetical protein